MTAEQQLLRGPVVVSPLVWCLAYRYPVHQIGPDNVPDGQPANSTELIVYRRRDDTVGFMVVNAMTLRLVALLPESASGGAALEALADELRIAGGAADAPDDASNNVYDHGVATLERLREAEIVLGTRILTG